MFILFPIALSLTCKQDEEECGSICINKQNQFCCDNRKICNQGESCCRWGGSSRLCYNEQTQVCCSLGKLCNKPLMCCGISCCKSDYYCWEGLSCKLEFYTGFHLIFPGGLSILSLLLVVNYIISNNKCTSQKSLSCVSDSEILQGLHNKQDVNQIDDKFNKNLENQIEKIRFNTRTEFEEFILGQLNSFYWKASSFISFFSILPLYLCVIYRESAVIYTPIILTLILGFTAQIMTTLKIGKVRYDKYGYYVLFFSIASSLFCFIFGMVESDTDPSRIASRIAPFICYLPTISVVSNSIKLVNNEDRTLLIGEAFSKTYDSKRIDSTTVMRTENIETLKIVVPYPNYLSLSA